MKWALLLAVCQSGDKELDKAAKQMAADFRKAYAKAEGDADKAAALDLLKKEDKLLPHELVFAELERLDATGPETTKKLIGLVSEADHPRCAGILADLAKTRESDVEIMKELAGAMDHCRWNVFYDAMGDFVEKRLFDSKAPEGTSKAATSAMKAAERAGWFGMGDRMVRLLVRMDEIQARAPTEKNVEFRKTMMRAVLACTDMKEIKDGKGPDYAKQWAAEKETMRKRTSLSFWCAETGTRYSRLTTDSKTVCTKHKDRKAADKAPHELAFESFK